MKHGHYLPVRVIREYAGQGMVDVQLANGQFVQTSDKNLVLHAPEPEAETDTPAESAKPATGKSLTQPTRTQKNAAKVEKIVHPFDLPNPSTEQKAAPPKVRTVKKPT